MKTEKNFISVNVSCEDKEYQHALLAALNKFINLLLEDTAILEESVKLEGYETSHSLVFTFESHP